jgi:starvation-inducible DNA-binding protein
MFKDSSHNLLYKKNDFFIERFSTLLANTYLVYLKTQNYHWNVEGSDFYMLHKFFEKQYQELGNAADEIAERIRILGASAPGSFNEFLKLTTLSDSPTIMISSEDMLHNLLKDHTLIIADVKTSLRIAENYDDDASKDLMIQRLRSHESMGWMIKSHLQEQDMQGRGDIK